MTAEFVEFEIERALEWLQSDRTEMRRLPAVLILRELAENAPTLLHPYIEVCTLSSLSIHPCLFVCQRCARGEGLRGFRVCCVLSFFSLSLAVVGKGVRVCVSACWRSFDAHAVSVWCFPSSPVLFQSHLGGTGGQQGADQRERGEDAVLLPHPRRAARVQEQGPVVQVRCPSLHGAVCVCASPLPRVCVCGIAQLPVRICPLVFAILPICPCVLSASHPLPATSTGKCGRR